MKIVMQIVMQILNRPQNHILDIPLRFCNVF